MQNSPLVSVIVPIYNTPIEYLKQCVDSLKSQTLDNFECILSDNNSNDEVGKYCAELVGIDKRFIYIKHLANLGAGEARNRGINISRGHYIAQLDSDDIADPKRLKEQYLFLEANKEIHVLGTFVKEFSETIMEFRTNRYPVDHVEIARAILVYNPIVNPSAMFRRTAIEVGGGYDPTMTYCEDWELYLRWVNRGLIFHNLETPLTYYRNNHNKLRPLKHWLMAIKALTINLKTNHILTRCYGITRLIVWAFLPRFIKKICYRELRNLQLDIH
jgi:glycosyltransferase involved in cell wall biosynthesis